MSKESKVKVVKRIPNGDDGLGWGEEYWLVIIPESLPSGKVEEHVMAARLSKASANGYARVLRLLEE